MALVLLGDLLDDAGKVGEVAEALLEVVADLPDLGEVVAALPDLLTLVTGPLVLRIVTNPMVQPL